MTKDKGRITQGVLLTFLVIGFLILCITKESL